MSAFTHYVVVNRDDRTEVLAWFPKFEQNAEALCRGLARMGNNHVGLATYVEGDGFVLDAETVKPWVEA